LKDPANFGFKNFGRGAESEPENMTPTSSHLRCLLLHFFQPMKYCNIGLVTFSWKLTRPAMSNRNSLLSQKLCHSFNQGCTLIDMKTPSVQRELDTISQQFQDGFGLIFSIARIKCT